MSSDYANVGVGRGYEGRSLCVRLRMKWLVLEQDGSRREIVSRCIDTRLWLPGALATLKVRVDVHRRCASTLSLLWVRDGMSEGLTQRGEARTHCPCAHVKLEVDGLIT